MNLAKRRKGQEGQKRPVRPLGLFSPFRPFEEVPMADIPKIVLPHGGYRNLIVYRKSNVIYQGSIAIL